MYSHMLFLYLEMYCPVRIAWRVLVQLYEGNPDVENPGNTNRIMKLGRFTIRERHGSGKNAHVDGGLSCFPVFSFFFACADSRDGWHARLLDS